MERRRVSRFQFLIGRLATTKEHFMAASFYEFQFLIGRLATQGQLPLQFY